MNSSAVRRRELLLGGATLLTGFAGCSEIENAIGRGQQTRLPPLVEVTVTNTDFRTYSLYLLIQSADGDIVDWGEYELSAATETGGILKKQAVGVGTGQRCVARFLVSISVDEGENWCQIGSHRYRTRYEDIPDNQGAAPEAIIRDGDPEFQPRLSFFPDEQCAKRTPDSEKASPGNASSS